jgi:hypothetical protein
MGATEKIVGGTYRKGRIVLDRPMKWPEGTRVVVQILSEHAGLIEGVWPDDGSPEGQAEILRRMKEFEPVEFTAAERAEISAARRTSKRSGSW